MPANMPNRKYSGEITGIFHKFRQIQATSKEQALVSARSDKWAQTAVQRSVNLLENFIKDETMTIFWHVSKTVPCLSQQTTHWLPLTLIFLKALSSEVDTILHIFIVARKSRKGNYKKKETRNRNCSKQSQKHKNLTSAEALYKNLTSTFNDSTGYFCLGRRYF